MTVEHVGKTGVHVLTARNTDLTPWRILWNVVLADNHEGDWDLLAGKCREIQRSSELIL